MTDLEDTFLQIYVDNTMLIAAAYHVDEACAGSW